MEERDQYNNWKFGIFYYNPDNPLFFVKKHNNAGYTINFGNKKIYFLILAIAILVYIARRL